MGVNNQNGVDVKAIGNLALDFSSFVGTISLVNG